MSLAKRRRQESRIFGSLEFAKIDFHRPSREPSYTDPVMLEFGGRDTESGSPPGFPRLREGTNCDDNPFNAYNIHAANLTCAWLTSLTWALSGGYLAIPPPLLTLSLRFSCRNNHVQASVLAS
jgi:hypothetical protein